MAAESGSSLRASRKKLSASSSRFCRSSTARAGRARGGSWLELPRFPEARPPPPRTCVPSGRSPLPAPAPWGLGRLLAHRLHHGEGPLEVPLIAQDRASRFARSGSSGTSRGQPGSRERTVRSLPGGPPRGSPGGPHRAPPPPAWPVRRPPPRPRSGSAAGRQSRGGSGRPVVAGALGGVSPRPARASIPSSWAAAAGKSRRASAIVTLR